jgi:hypothetical protein
MKIVFGMNHGFTQLEAEEFAAASAVAVVTILAVLPQIALAKYVG